MNDKQNMIKILITQLNNKRIEFNKIIKKQLIISKQLCD